MLHVLTHNVQIHSFDEVYDAATTVYPCDEGRCLIDRGLIENGDTVVIEGKMICKDVATPRWKPDLELEAVYLLEKADTRALVRKVKRNCP